MSFKKELSSIINSNDFEYVCTISNDNPIIQVVEDKNTKKKYAKKIFNLEDNNDIEYFRREVRVLYHANIKGLPFSSFYGYNYHEKGESFILTKYLENGSLGLVLEEEPENLTDTNKMIIFYGVAFGLDYLHSTKGIMHRDIKPDNIFLDEDMKPYIGDFGFARLINENIKMTKNIGSIFYMAPELFKESNESYDFSVDSYSYAISVLHVLSKGLTLRDSQGKILSENDINNPEDIGQYIINGCRFSQIDDLPDGSPFKKFIEDCWSSETSKRWTMKKILDAMKSQTLFLPGCNLHEFNDYVRELDEALDRHKHEEEEDDDDEEEEEEEETKEFVFD